MNPRYKYVLDYFRLVYGGLEDIQIGYGSAEGRVGIRASRTSYFDDFQPFPTQNVVWKNWRDKRIPFLFDADDSQRLVDNENGRWIVNYDLVASAFYFLSGWQEYFYMREFSALRYPFDECLQEKLGIIDLPVVNYYFDILKHTVEQAYSVSLSMAAWGHNPMAICLTHDIDACRGGWKTDALSEVQKLRPLTVAKMLGRRLLGQDPWDNLASIIHLEKKYEATSSFNFIARKGQVYQNDAYSRFDSNRKTLRAAVPDTVTQFFRDRRTPGYSTEARNADYQLDDRSIRQAFEIIESAGSEIGIHGSFGSHVDMESLAGELRRFPLPITGGRFHYLYFDITTTFRILEELGLAYDSTLGFAEKPGFRNGIAFPFVPFNIEENRPYRLLEIPLIAMDTTFRIYTETALAEIPVVLEKLLEEVRRFNGCFTILWHNWCFSPYRFAGWREIYEGVLKLGIARGALLLSADQVNERWRKLLAKQSAPLST